MNLNANDIQAGGFGGWGHGRTWSNRTEQATGGHGPGWTVGELPSLKQAGTSIILQPSGQSVRLFAASGGGFVAPHGSAEVLQAASGSEYRFVDTRGNATFFNDFTVAADLQGKIKRFKDPAGNVTTFTYASGKLTRAERVDAASGAVQATIYTYVSGGVNDGMTATVSLEITRAAVATVVRQTAYDYYTGAAGEPGVAHQLSRATIRDGSGTALESQLYRYYRGEAGGPPGSLKYVVEGRQYARLAATVANPLFATEAQVTPFADFILGYDKAGRVVTKQQLGAGCTCAGSTGQGTFKYAYADSGLAAGYNTWSTKCTELLPDGTDTDDTDNDRTITYCNYAGQPMLQVRQQGSTGSKWITYYRYDGSGRVILRANPSAVTGYDESKTDLVNVVAGNAQYLADAAGLIEVTQYGASTTAMAGTAGNVAGYVQSSSERIGELGTDIPVGAQTYWAHTGADGVTIYPLASTTAYRNTNGTGAQTTGFAYTWQGTSNRIASRTVTAPVVPTAQNGSNAAVSSTEVFDSIGRMIWSRDEAGFLAYTEYDQATGAVTKTIRDVKTALSGDFANLPGGWTTPAGGGKHLLTLCRVDLFGRCTKETDPLGNVTYTVYRDPQFEVRTYQGWSGTAATAPTRINREDRVRNYRERLTISDAPALTASEPNGTEAIATVRSLERDLLDNGGRIVALDVYVSAPTYAQTTPLGTLNTHYYETSYFYDKRGRQARVQDGMGTIIRLEYDALDRLVSRWSGTNDTVGSGFWSPTNNGAPSNMVKIAERHYDLDAVGDGDLTSSVDIPDATTSYTTQYRYDGRNRLVKTRDPAGIATVRTLDNIGQATQVDLFADANGNLALDAGEQRGRSLFGYDERGQRYLVQERTADPASGALGNTLSDNHWFDPRGLLVKTRGSNGQLRKISYDGAGRARALYLSIDNAESSYAEALTVTGDTVIEQNESIYNANGDEVASTRLRRHDNDGVSTGALAANNAFIDVAVSWYDAARRLVGTAAFGRDNGATRYVWDATGALIDSNANGIPNEAEGGPRTPNTSDDYRVTRYAYNLSGRLYRTTDNLNRITERQFDLSGRVKKVIEAYADGVASEAETATDRVTEYGYNPGWQVWLMRAYDPKGAGQGVQQQDTRYFYQSPINKAWATNILYPDSADTGPSGTDQVKYTYDRLGRRTTSTDQRQTVHAYAYDSAGRMASDAVTTLGSGADGAVRRIGLAYDSLSRPSVVSSYDAASAGTVLNQVGYTYDGYGMITAVAESHAGAIIGSTPKVQYGFADGASGGNALYVRPSTVTYPSGTIQHYLYPSAGSIGDRWSRLDRIAEDAAGAVINAGYTYFGLGGVLLTTHPAVTGGLRLDYGVGAGYAGLNRFGEVIDQRWRNDASVSIDRAQYFYDRMGRKVYRDLTWSGAPTNADENYVYDAFDRLVRFNRGTLASGAIADAASTYNQDWALDELANWRTFRIDANGGANSWADQARSHNKTNEIDVDDLHGNAAGASISGAMNWVDPTFDSTGNMTLGPIPGNETVGQTYVYDAWNRLVAVKNAAGSATIATYAYDGIGRRIKRTVTSPASTSDIYFGSGWQEMEVRANGSSSAVEQYVWDPRNIDAIVLRRRDTDGNGSLDETLYVTQDVNCSVTGVVTAAGVFAERYQYDPYGKRTIFAPDGTTVRSTSSYGINYGFTGRIHDIESGLIQFRSRMWDTGLGRFINRDLLGYIDGMSLYAGYFVPNSIDPSGFGDPVGHHFVPTAVQEGLGLSAEARALLSVETTGPIPTGHFWDKPHSDFNSAVKEATEKFMSENRIVASRMTREEAGRLLQVIKGNTDPRISKYLASICELQSVEKKVAEEALSELKRLGLKRTTGNLLNLTRQIASKAAVPITLLLIGSQLAAGEDPMHVAKNAIIPADLIEGIATSSAQGLENLIENSLGAPVKGYANRLIEAAEEE